MATASTIATRLEVIAQCSHPTSNDRRHSSLALSGSKRDHRLFVVAGAHSTGLKERALRNPVE